MNKRLLRAVIGVGLVLVLVLALPLPLMSGCAKAPPETIKIGHIVPLTGDLSFIGKPYVNAATLAVDQINAAGGVLGRKIEIITEDTATNPTTAVDALQKLITVDKVQAVVGPATSAESIACIPKLVANKVVMISPSATSVELTTMRAKDDEFFFRTAPPDDAVAAATAIEAWNKGYRTANVIGRDDTLGRSLDTLFIKKFEELGGKIGVEVIYDPKAPDLSSYVAKVSSVPADVIDVNPLMEDAIKLFKLFHDTGIMSKYKFLGSEGIQDPTIPKAVGVDVMVGVGGASSYPKGSGTFVKDFTARFGVAPSSYEANVYDNFVLLALAIEKAGKYDGTAIRDNLRAVANPPGVEVTDVAEALRLVREGAEINYQGAGGEITFDEFGDVFMKAARVWEYDEEGQYSYIREIEIF